MDLSLPVIAALTGVAFVAGLIDAIAGGGGLLTVPALLATGLPTPIVFGTNKGASVFGSGSALWRFWRAGLIDTRRARVLFPLGFFGSLVGAGLLTLVDPQVLRPVVLVLLLAAGVVVAFVRPVNPAGAGGSGPAGAGPAGAGPAGAGPALGRHAGAKTALLALVIGTYDGFFGPGTGTFLIIGFVLLLHLSLQEASANAKVVNFASNLAAMILFSWKGLVLWKVSLPMAAGQLLGGAVGAGLAVKRGDTLVRRVVLLVVLAMVARLGYDLLHTP